MKVLQLSLIFAIGCQITALSSPFAGEFKELTTPRLQTRFADLDAELTRLPQFTPRGGPGNIGWISKPTENPAHPEWVEVELPESSSIDQIIIVPILWNYADEGALADGFPEAFEIIAGNDYTSEGRVLARFSPKDRFLPRFAPMVIRFPPTKASWVRVRATQISASASNGKHVFSLAEIMVFDGDRNIALRQPVRASSAARGNPSVYKDSLTDGFTPYLMDGPGIQSPPFVAHFPESETFSFVIDLEASYLIDSICFHSFDVGGHFPKIVLPNYGIPRHLLVEGAEEADFSDAHQLLEYRPESIYDSGSIISGNFPQTACRYIRLSVPVPYENLEMPATRRCVVGIAELEVISNGQDIAQGKTVLFPPAPRNMSRRNRQSVTDGHNRLGAILPVRKWMEQLARRHDLERERPRIALELDQRYERQKINLHRMSWLAILLTVCIVCSIVIGRILRRQAVSQVRERITANLHDELSANLHAIGLLSDMARDKVAEQEALPGILDRIRQLTERSGRTARHWVNLLDADNLCADLLVEMKRTSDSLLGNIEHTFDVKGEDMIGCFPPYQRTNLFLFYKECLTNIIRHTNATHVTTFLEADTKGLRMTVTDSGQGTASIPPSLQRRSRLLRAKIQVESPTTGGTKVSIRLRKPFLKSGLRQRPKKTE